MDYIIHSGIDYEFRTTAAPGIVEPEDIPDIIDLIKNAKKYVIAQFRQENSLDEKYRSLQPHPMKTLEKMKLTAEQAGIYTEIRANYN